MLRIKEINFKKLTIIFTLFCLLLINPLNEAPRAEEPLSVSILTTPTYEPTGMRLKALLDKHNIKVDLVITKLSAMKKMVFQKDFFLVSFSDLMMEPILREVAQAVAPADYLYVHLATLEDFKIEEVDHLKRKHISIGPKDDPTWVHALDTLRAENLRCNGNLLCERYGIQEQAMKLINKQIQAFFLSAPKEDTEPLKMVAREADLDLVPIRSSTIHRMNQTGSVPYDLGEINLSIYEENKKKKIPTAATPIMNNATRKTNPSTVETVGKILVTESLLGPKGFPAVLKRVKPFVSFHPEMDRLIKHIIRE